MKPGLSNAVPSTDQLGRLLDGLEGRGLSAVSAEVALGDAITALVLSASGLRQLDERLHEVCGTGYTGDVASVLQILVERLPNDGLRLASPQETKPLRAMGRLVLLPHDPRQRAQRLSALVRAAIAYALKNKSCQLQ